MKKNKEDKMSGEYKRKMEKLQVENEKLKKDILEIPMISFRVGDQCMKNTVEEKQRCQLEVKVQKERWDKLKDWVNKKNEFYILDFEIKEKMIELENKT